MKSDSFKKLKQVMSDARTLAYYNQDKKTVLITDASPVGLGGILAQESNGKVQVVSYASRSLTSVERRYSQTEKEALAIVWACERFHVYLYGVDFDIITDHKPLEFIYSCRSKPSARIERWVLRLQPYRFKVKYQPGALNAADSLSRLCQGNHEVSKEVRNVAEEYIYFVAENAVPKALTAKELELASHDDEELGKVRQCIKTGNWGEVDSDIRRKYQAIQNELSTIGYLVLRGTRILVPEVHRSQVIKLAHEGHQGIVKTKQRLREKVWWPGIDKEAERICRSCHACQVVGQASQPEPMKRALLPNGPWQQVAIDLMGPFPSGESVLVVVDYYSRYFEVAVMHSTSSTKVI